MSSKPSDRKKVAQIFEFLSTPNMPEGSPNAIVFGRKDELVARALADLAARNAVGTAVVTGGIGKDSGDLKERGLTEAEWLKPLAVEMGMPADRIILETRARHGGENATFGLGMLGLYGLDTAPLTVVAHATSLRRLAEGVEFAADNAGIELGGKTFRVPTAYSFDPDKPSDAGEAVAEYARLINWPGQGLLKTQTDLDPNLVDYVRDVSGE